MEYDGPQIKLSRDKTHSGGRAVMESLVLRVYLDETLVGSLYYLDGLSWIGTHDYRNTKGPLSILVEAMVAAIKLTRKEIQ